MTQMPELSNSGPATKDAAAGRGGLLIPASLAGLGPGSGQDTLVAAWYAGLTVLALALAYRARGVGRAQGAAIIAGYLAFVTGGGALLLALPAARPAARI
jgi:hypothetical protein